MSLKSVSWFGRWWDSNPHVWTLAESNQWLGNWYLSLPSLAHGIVTIEQRAVEWIRQNRPWFKCPLLNQPMYQTPPPKKKREKKKKKRTCYSWMKAMVIELWHYTEINLSRLHSLGSALGPDIGPALTSALGPVPAARHPYPPTDVSSNLTTTKC